VEILTGRTPLYLRRWGVEGGRPLLFVHALGPASSSAFLGLGVQPLVDAGFDVAAPDLPGYGGSPALGADEYAVPALATLMAGLAGTLGWERFDLVGHSWGGAIACHMTAARPEMVRSLVLVDSGHLDYGETPGVDLDSSVEELSATAEAARLRLPDRTHVAEFIGTDEDDVLVDAFLEGMEPDEEGHLVSRTTGSASGAARFHLARSKQSETWPLIAGQQIPTLLLLATEPEQARQLNEGGAERFAAVMPHAEVRWVEGATHSLITDERERFGATLVEWLETHAPGTTGR
jgi:pimeloyl-ACP methyl ester carboxylesterase